jgi:hypothetical protein
MTFFSLMRLLMPLMLAVPVLIWSNNTNISDHILNELNQAFDSGITVMPFIVENRQSSKLTK